MHPENLSHPRGCGPHSRQPQHGPVTWGAGSPHVALRAGEDGGQMVTAALFITAKQKPAWENERACPATTRVHTEAGQLLRFPGLTEAWSKRRTDIIFWENGSSNLRLQRDQKNSGKHQVWSLRTSPDSVGQNPGPMSSHAGCGQGHTRH